MSAPIVATAASQSGKPGHARPVRSVRRNRASRREQGGVACAKRVDAPMQGSSAVGLQIRLLETREDLSLPGLGSRPQSCVVDVFDVIVT